MYTEAVTNRQGFMLTVLALMTNSYSVLFGSQAGEDAVVAQLIAAAAACVLAYLLARLCDRYASLSVYSILKRLLGKAAGNVIACVLALLALLSGVVSIVVFNRFIQLTALPSTPQIIIPLLLVSVAVFSFRTGLLAASGAAKLVFWFAVAVFAAFVVFGLEFVRVDAVLPVLTDIPRAVTAAGSTFVNRFGLVLFLMPVYTQMPRGKGRRRVFVSAVLTAGVAMSLIAFMTVATLGGLHTSRDLYPVFTAMSIRDIGGFIQHMEILTSVAMTLCIFFKTVVALRFATEMAQGVFSLREKRRQIMPLGLICVSATQLIYRSSPRLWQELESVPAVISLLALELVLPLILVFISGISVLRRKSP